VLSLARKHSRTAERHRAFDDTLRNRDFLNRRKPLQQQPPLTPESKPQVELPRRLLVQEKDMIEAALKESRGRIFGPAGAAAKLGIPRSTLESKIKSLKINKNRFRQSGNLRVPASQKLLQFIFGAWRTQLWLVGRWECRDRRSSTNPGKSRRTSVRRLHRPSSSARGQAGAGPAGR
jgi:hypothetical protein